MFQMEIPPGNGFLSWILQQIVAPIPFVLWALLMNPLEARIGPWAMRRKLLDLILYLPIGWGLSFLLAVAIQHVFPRAAALGRRIWVLPVALLSLALCWDSFRFSFGIAFKELFYPDMVGLGGLVFLLMTCPTISAITYSIGMEFAAHRARMRPKP